MKISLTILYCLLLVVFIASCNDKQPINPNPDPVEEEIRIEDYLYDYNYEKEQCISKLVYYSESSDLSKWGITISSSNKNRTIFFCGKYSFLHNLLILDNGKSKLENFDFATIQRQDTVPQIVLETHFCPYDNNLALVLVRFRIGFGFGGVFFDDWYYYRFSTKTFERLNLDDPKFESIKGKNVVLRWLDNSSQGKDNFFLQNNTIITYPSGNVQPNPSGFALRPDEKVHSISPDMKKIFTNLNGELYLNGNKVEKSQFQFWDFLPINWSDDSQYFLGVGLEANPGAQLNIVYKMENGSINKFKIYRIADMMRKYCTNQHPSRKRFDELSNSYFLSDTSFAMTLFLDLRDVGNLYEVNFKGDTLRNLSNWYQ
jgi:hypothetical protein